MPLPALTGLTPEALAAWLQGVGEPAFRATQILEWVWQKKVGDINQMTNLPAALRDKLTQSFKLTALDHAQTQGAPDSTRKFLFRLHDGRYIESVLIPANPALYGGKSDRRTLCVSSQVGCAYGCRFCASGMAGFARNLEPAEIAGQVLAATQLTGERVDNIVFMGMGEPLANLANLLASIVLITGEKNLHVGARHLTISTAGLVPQIRQLAAHPQQIRLAISLHGASDDVRQQIMPVANKWPLAELIAALDYWNSRKNQQLTLEYILIQGVNDALAQASLLARHARHLRAKVNLIPYNTVRGLAWVRPPDSHCRAFLAVLNHAGVAATLRLEKGHAIDAACGQLRLQQEAADGLIPG